MPPVRERLCETEPDRPATLDIILVLAGQGFVPFFGQLCRWVAAPFTLDPKGRFRGLRPLVGKSRGWFQDWDISRGAIPALSSSVAQQRWLQTVRRSGRRDTGDYPMRDVTRWDALNTSGGYQP